MTLRTSLHDYLRETVDVSVFDVRLSTRPMFPALVLRFISAVATETHSNPRSLLPRRVQIGIWALNEPEVDEVATRVLLALDGYHGPLGDVAIGWAMMLNDLDQNPEPSPLKGDGQIRYHRTMDFEISYQEVRDRPAVPSSSS